MRASLVARLESRWPGPADMRAIEASELELHGAGSTPCSGRTGDARGLPCGSVYLYLRGRSHQRSRLASAERSRHHRHYPRYSSRPAPPRDDWADTRLAAQHPRHRTHRAARQLNRSDYLPALATAALLLTAATLQLKRGDV
jgi:hypothetical protein